MLIGCSYGEGAGEVVESVPELDALRDGVIITGDRVLAVVGGEAEAVDLRREHEVSVLAEAVLGGWMAEELRFRGVTECDRFLQLHVLIGIGNIGTGEDAGIGRGVVGELPLAILCIL